jgi:hypothetical protein
MDNKKKGTFIGTIIALIIIMTIVVTKCSQSTPLPAYSGDGEATPSPAPTALPFESQDYIDEELQLYIKVPAGWQYVVKSGYPTYIHKESASSIQIQVNDYSPYVLYVTQESLENEIAAAGGNMTEYVKIDDTQYIVRYLLDGMVYTERTMFDRQKVVRIVYTVSEKNMVYLGDTVNASIQSIVWNVSSPFPAGFKVMYNEFGNFEYAVPENWYYGVVDDAFFAQSPDTGATMSLAVAQVEADYSSITQNDYISYMLQRYPGYILNSCASDRYMIYGVGSYSSGTDRYMLIQYIMAKNGFEYTITFSCPYDKYNDEAQLYTDTINVFRFF